MHPQGGSALLGRIQAFEPILNESHETTTLNTYPTPYTLSLPYSPCTVSS